MKLLTNLIVVIVFFSSTCLAQKSLLINGHKYKITKNKIFLKDEKLFINSLQYLDKKNDFQFGFTSESKRNDSIFINGNMKIKGKNIICIERYFFNYFRWDSIIRTYKQNKKGLITLQRYIEYKNGRITKQYDHR